MPYVFPQLLSITATPSTADLSVGAVVILTLHYSGGVTVTGGTPTLNLSDGGTAIYDAALTTVPTSLNFSYTVAEGQNTTELQVNSVALNGAQIIVDGAYPAESFQPPQPATVIQIDTTAPVVSAPTVVTAENASASIGIAAPADVSALTITLNALPTNGTVTLADGSALSAGQMLTVAQLTGLIFAPTMGLYDATSTLNYTATDAAGNASMARVTLRIGSDTSATLESNVTYTVAQYGDALLIPAGVIDQITSGVAVDGYERPSVITVAGEVNGYFYQGFGGSYTSPFTINILSSGVVAGNIYLQRGSPLTSNPPPTLILNNQGLFEGGFTSAFSEINLINSGYIENTLSIVLGSLYTSYASPIPNATIANSGTMTSQSGDGLYINAGLSVASFTISNSVTGVISAANASSFGIEIAGYPGSLTNSGTITNAGQILDGIYDSAASTYIVNAGSISGSFVTTQYTNIVNYGAMFTQIIGYGPLDLTNIGQIYGDIGPPIAHGASQPLQGNLNIDNTGTITGSIDEPFDSGTILIRNLGTITGSVTLGSGNDYIDSTQGTIMGSVSLGNGNDVFLGGVGAVTVTAGSGNDVIYAGSAPSLIYAGAGNDTLVGGGAGDVIYGGSGTDVIYGTGGNNVLAAGTGNNTIIGGTGNDFIDAGTGQDLLYGGSGYNEFAFHPGFGNDIIADFQMAGYGDHIWFEAGTFADYASVQANMQQVGGNVVITAGPASTVTLVNTTVGGLTADHFNFS